MLLAKRRKCGLGIRVREVSRNAAFLTGEKDFRSAYYTEKKFAKKLKP